MEPFTDPITYFAMFAVALGFGLLILARTMPK
mgnify:CR=1 FL=1|jgi:hypothetical protein